MLNYLKQEANYTVTENGAVTHKSTLNRVLDVFALGGAVRNRINDDLYYKMIVPALEQNTVLAMKTIFHLADIREGQGERAFFKLVLKNMAKEYPDVLAKVLPLVPHYTRWDYLYELDGTKLENLAYSIIRQEVMPLINEPTKTSLVFKWLKSVNTSSAVSTRLGKKTAMALGLSIPRYRKLLSAKRKLLGDAVVETKLSAKAYDDINYSQVPSRAGFRYKKAFRKNDGKRYETFLEKAETGEVKINTANLYPYDFIYKVRTGDNDKALDVMWKNLPDYAKTSENILPLVDVSGSMLTRISEKTDVTAIDVSIGLGMYLAEHNTGKFANHFLTFSSRPALVEIVGKTLFQKYHTMVKSDWTMTTNVEAAFQLILDTAVKYNLPQSEMPSKIVIFSDMEFDRCVTNPTDTNYINLQKKFASKGYEIPQVVFWNVCARNSQVPVTFNQRGTALVSGLSPITLKFVLAGEITTPEDLMLSVINTERYQPVEDVLVA